MDSVPSPREVLDVATGCIADVLVPERATTCRVELVVLGVLATRAVLADTVELLLRGETLRVDVFV